jgi:hypothetical protein
VYGSIAGASLGVTIGLTVVFAGSLRFVGTTLALCLGLVFAFAALGAVAFVVRALVYKWAYRKAFGESRPGEP